MILFIQVATESDVWALREMSTWISKVSRRSLHTLDLQVTHLKSFEIAGTHRSP